MNWREQISEVPSERVVPVNALQWSDLLNRAVAPSESQFLTHKLADLRLGIANALKGRGVEFVGIYVRDIKLILDMLPPDTESAAVNVGPNEDGQIVIQPEDSLSISGVE